MMIQIDRAPLLEHDKKGGRGTRLFHFESVEVHIAGTA